MVKQKPGPVRPSASVRHGQSDDVLYFAVLYTKRSRRKNKVFRDGFMTVRNDRALTLLDDTGKRVTQSSSTAALGGLNEGNTVELNSYELEIDHAVAAKDFISGRLFMSEVNAPNSLTSVASVKEGMNASAVACSSAVSRAFQRPRTLGGRVASTAPRIARPLHDPLCPNAVVLQKSFVQPCGRKAVAIVLDPYLARHMRPHQKEGVKFLYQCVEGKNSICNGPRGAILADEMGLGKSLQSIALIWTLLKQGPLGSPVAEKAIIVCPASLVANWAAEIKKWLGDERLQPIQIRSGLSKSVQGLEAVQNFVHGKVKRVLIISYDMFRNCGETLYNCGCGILVCDEGHRLKSSSGNKTIEALMRMPCRRRVLLTGTPVQNNLSEFYAMCTFVNPGVFGDFQRFRHVFACPIEKSRHTGANAEAFLMGEKRATELQRITSRFVLRRTSKMLESYLPPKTEIVVFCRLSSKQETAYEVLCSSFLSSLRQGESSSPLPLINALRKICCHPSMIMNTPSLCCTVDNDKTVTTSTHNDVVRIGECFPRVSATGFKPGAVGSQELADSGKIRVGLSLIMAALAVGDRVVLVSNFTATLDLMGLFLDAHDLSYMRLDGSTPAHRRSDIVKEFNSAQNGSAVFLLSAKAGGVGLNLIGANRLISFDPDWNPATDLQSMARVWRDGQKKAVFIYRLICTGTIEEKIYQRQLFKGELQVAVGSSNLNMSHRSRSSSMPPRSQAENGGNFTAEELKDLFTYGKGLAYCDTLRVLEASRSVRVSEDDRTEAPTLLNSFGAYRSVLEASYLKTLAEGVGDLGPERFLPCGFDDVLSHVLNENDISRGLVSYLFTVETGHPCSDLPQGDPAEYHRSPGRHEKVYDGSAKFAASVSPDVSNTLDGNDDDESPCYATVSEFGCDEAPSPAAEVSLDEDPSSGLTRNVRVIEKENLEGPAPVETLWSTALHDLDEDV